VGRSAERADGFAERSQKEAFSRTFACPGPTGVLLVWFGDDPLDADDAAKLRQWAREIGTATSS
jgi:hypothetical protein